MLNIRKSIMALPLAFMYAASAAASEDVQLSVPKPLPNTSPLTPFMEFPFAVCSAEGQEYLLQIVLSAPRAAMEQQIKADENLMEARIERFKGVIEKAVNSFKSELTDSQIYKGPFEKSLFLRTLISQIDFYNRNTKNPATRKQEIEIKIDITIAPVKGAVCGPITFNDFPGTIIPA